VVRSSFALDIFIRILLFSFIGVAWNLMGGYAKQLRSATPLFRARRLDLHHHQVDSAFRHGSGWPPRHRRDAGEPADRLAVFPPAWAPISPSPHIATAQA